MALEFGDLDSGLAFNEYAVSDGLTLPRGGGLGIEASWKDTQLSDRNIMPVEQVGGALKEPALYSGSRFPSKSGPQITDAFTDQPPEATRVLFDPTDRFPSKSGPRVTDVLTPGHRPARVVGKKFERKATDQAVLTGKEQLRGHQTYPVDKPVPKIDPENEIDFAVEELSSQGMPDSDIRREISRRFGDHQAPRWSPRHN